MGKGFKKFREWRDDDEWGSDDDYRQRRKEAKMESRRNKRKMKRNERNENFSEDVKNKR